MKDMTKGKPMVVLLLFAIPLILGNVVQQCYGLVDTMIVGNYLGETKLAAVGATAPVSDFMISFINGMTTGFAIIIARYFGAKDMKNMKKAIGGTVTLSFITTLIMVVAGLLFIRPVLRMLNVEDAIIQASLNYILVIIGGMFFTTLYNAEAAILRAVGNTVMPLVFLVVSAVLNMGLDYIFVRFFGWGVMGAAAATIISQALSGIACFIYIRVGAPELNIGFADLPVKKELFAELMKQGLSVGFMNSFVSIGTVLLQGAINHLGTNIIAAHLTARKIFGISIVPIFVMSMSSATYSSQNFGAGRFDRVKQGMKAAILLAWSWSAIMIVCMMFLAPWIVHMVSGSNLPEVINNGANYLKIACCLYPALAVLVIMRNVMQGIGYTYPPIISSTLELIGKVVAVYILAPRLGYFGVMITEPIIWVVCALTLLGFFIAGMKKYEKIAEENREKTVCSD